MDSAQEVVDKSQTSTLENPNGTGGNPRAGIQVDVVRICGFRGIADIEVTLPRVTVLLGNNNSGKTSVIKAMQLALGDYARYLSDEDFYVDENGKRHKEIIVDIRFIPTEGAARSAKFSEQWQREFGRKIQLEADLSEFFAFRTSATPDTVKTGQYDISRFYLNSWPAREGWQHAEVLPRNRFGERLDSIPFISIDAQRDIHSELTERHSFIGRFLASIEYRDEDIATLEAMVAKINMEAVEKSEPLKLLRGHLNRISQSFDGSGNAEITPFPKRLRDLSRRYGIHFGTTESQSFAMEYHGMGTRSWASMLAVNAFVELLAESHHEEVKPFFAILAAEEPEAHLHPNAQRTIFNQLQEHTGQVIVSTHSPYLAGMCDLENLRVLIRTPESVAATRLVDGLEPGEIKKLRREVMRFRGEILFSKALVLFEGVTEEQVIPAMFHAYFGKSAYSLGINFVGVGSNTNYAPFIKMALSFGIPVCIISDNEQETKVSVNMQINKTIDQLGLSGIPADKMHTFFLGDGNDFEKELIERAYLRNEVVAAFRRATEQQNKDQIRRTAAELRSLSNGQLISKMHKHKAMYAGFLADVILENPDNKPRDKLAPRAVIDVFKKLIEWQLVEKETRS